MKSYRCQTAHVGEQRAAWNWWTVLLDWTTRMAYTAVHLARAPENRQRQPAMLTFRHRYMYVVTEAYRMHKY